MQARHLLFMKKAITAAQRARQQGEVPIGAVLVKNDKVVARGHNLTRTKADPTGHAEMVVIRKAIARLKNERFLDTVLYVTLEPCSMCAGAIVQARIPVVVFGAYDAKAGACGSALTVLPNVKLNHRPTVIGGVMAVETAAMLTEFFQERRLVAKAARKERRENGIGK